MDHDEDREQSRIDHALSALDDPMPPLRVESIVAHAAEPPRGSRAWVPRAAAVAAALLLLGAVAWAIPGSPVRSWIHGVLAPPATTETPAPNAADASGIAVDPGMIMTVKFMARQPEGEIQVLLGAGPELKVRASAGAATFVSETNRVIVDNRGSAASFTVEVPRGAPRVVIVLDEIVVFMKAGPDIKGDWRIPLTR